MPWRIKSLEKRCPSLVDSLLLLLLYFAYVSILWWKIATYVKNKNLISSFFLIDVGFVLKNSMNKHPWMGGCGCTTSSPIYDRNNCTLGGPQSSFKPLTFSTLSYQHAYVAKKEKETI